MFLLDYFLKNSRFSHITTSGSGQSDAWLFVALRSFHDRLMGRLSVRKGGGLSLLWKSYLVKSTRIYDRPYPGKGAVI